MGRAEAEGPVGSRASPQAVRPAAQVSRGLLQTGASATEPRPASPIRVYANQGSQRRQSERGPALLLPMAGPGAGPARPGLPGSSSGAAEGVLEPAPRRAGALLRLPSPLGSSAWSTDGNVDCEDLSRFLRLAEQREGNFLGFPHSFFPELAV